MAADKSIGVFLEALPVELMLDFAEAAEQGGFGSIWIPEITFGDAFVPAAGAALRTKEIEIATGVVGIWSRTPVTMAMTAASLHRLSGERLTLGLGLQARAYVDNWHGLRYERPLRAMREYLTIVRQILDGGRVTHEGDLFRVQGFQLFAQPPERNVPIYIAAIAPKMIQLAGELADGLIGYFYSTEYVRDVVVPNLEIGAERVGRSLEGFDVAAGLPAVITPDESGIELSRGQVVMFATAMSSSPGYTASISAAGFGSELLEIQERVARADMDGALAVVTEEMADAFSVSGTPEHAHQRIADYRAAGLTTVVLNPSPPGIYFPLFEGHFPPDAVLPEFSFPDFLQVIQDTIGMGASA